MFSFSSATVVLSYRGQEVYVSPTMSIANLKNSHELYSPIPTHSWSKHPLNCPSFHPCTKQNLLFSVSLLFSIVDEGHDVSWKLHFSHIISLCEFNLPLIRFLYVTHATQALQSHDLSGEGIKLWITYILFWPHKDMEGLPGWVIFSVLGPPPRRHKHKRRYTPGTHSFIPTRRIWNDYGGQMILRNLWA